MAITKILIFSLCFSHKWSKSHHPSSIGAVLAARKNRKSTERYSPTAPLGLLWKDPPNNCLIYKAETKICTVQDDSEVKNQNNAQGHVLRPIPIVCIIFNQCLFLLDTTFYSNPDSFKKGCSHAAGSHIWLPRQPIGKREAWCHAVAIVRSSSPSLRERYIENMKAAQKLLSAPTIGGWSAWAGGGGGGS